MADGRVGIGHRPFAEARASGPGAEVLEEVEAALAGADEVDVAVVVDVDGGHLEAGAGGAGGEVLLGVAPGGVGGGVLGGLAAVDLVAGPFALGAVELVPGDHGRVDVAVL